MLVTPYSWSVSYLELLGKLVVSYTIKLVGELLRKLLGKLVVSYTIKLVGELLRELLGKLVVSYTIQLVGELLRKLLGKLVVSYTIQREFTSAPCLAGGKNLMTARVLILLK